MANFHFDTILDPNETIKTVTFMYSNDGIQYYDVCGYTKKHKSLNILNKLSTQHRILIVADFYLDKVLPANVPIVGPLIQILNLS